MHAIKWQHANSEWESWADGEVLRVPHEIPERARAQINSPIRMREWGLDGLVADVTDRELVIYARDGDADLLSAPWDELHTQLTTTIATAIAEANNDEQRDASRRDSMLNTLHRLAH